jgi:hypothetical protein
MEINNVVIFDGIKEYSKEEILKNQELMTLVNRSIAFGSLQTLIDKINKEGGILKITTDANLLSIKRELLNVSSGLLSEFETM